MKTVMMTQEIRKSSEFPPMWWSLPNDVALNILARVSRIHHPSLSLVSKSFRSLLASRELDVTRNLIGKTENFIYLCLELPGHNPKRCWFILARQKLVPIPSFPCEHPESPSVVSVGSEIYIIGGFLKEERSRRVFALDCKSHQWRILPEKVPRGNSAAGLIDGKIYVLGGCVVGESLGEIYDPKTQTWEPLSATTLAPDSSIHDFIAKDRWLFFPTNFCFVGQEKILCTSWRCLWNRLRWCDVVENLRWREVKGLEKLPDTSEFLSLANSAGGRRLTVWWVSYIKEEDEDHVRKVEIWCAEILLDRRSRDELLGNVEWSKMIYTTDWSESSGFVSFFCSAATVMY